MTDALQSCVGRRIVSMRIAENRLYIRCEDQTTLIIWDDARYCCETRYMYTADNLQYFEGAVLMNCTVCCGRVVPLDEDQDEVNDVMFVNIETSKGVCTIETHNDHNGYYGGFCLEYQVVTGA